MTQAEIKELLREMKGKTFLYRGEKLLLLTFDIRIDLFVIKFDKQEIKKDEAQMPAFIELLMNNEVIEEQSIAPTSISKPQHKEASTEGNAVTKFQESIYQNNDKMFDIIDDMILRVKNDPSFVPQANAVNDLLKTKIEATKTAIMASKI